jgi:hypothetical protein
MAEPRLYDPVLLMVAAFSRHPEALQWAHEPLQQIYGEIALASPPYHFSQTTYYEPTMGPELHKQFLVFRELVDAERLAEIKLRTNALEKELANAGLFPEPRPLNLDPGLLSLGKFSLATTKDQAHRLYLRDGIFAEVTLRFQAGAFEPWPWTYADYRQPVVLAFMAAAREFYRQRLGEEKSKKAKAEEQEP